MESDLGTVVLAAELQRHTATVAKIAAFVGTTAFHRHSSPATVFRPGPPPSLLLSARYRGKGTDLSRVPFFQRTPTDSGSSEVQIARLTARVTQLTAHLKEHKKDFSTRRGLMQVLSRRKQLLIYLHHTDRPKYEHLLATLGIRAPKSGGI